MNTTNPNVEVEKTHRFVVDSKNIETVIDAIELRKTIGPFPFRVHINDNPVTFLNGTEVDYFITGYRILGRHHH